jgi:large subunit ribosomal protein L25
MELQIQERTAETKSDLKKIRREGHIPAVLYSKGEEGKEIIVDGGVFRKFLNTLEPGSLSATIFTLQLGNARVPALIKEIQYKITTYDVSHLDFVQLHEEIPVTLSIPIQCINTVDCVGVKLGGTLRQPVRYILVRCKPKFIPSKFEIDVKNLGLGQGIKLSEITIPEGVRPMVDLNRMAVLVARK